MLAGSFVRFFGGTQPQPEATNSGSPFFTSQQIAAILSRYESRRSFEATEQAETQQEPESVSSVTAGIPGSLLKYRRQIAELEAQALADWTEQQRLMAALYELDRILADAEALAALRVLRNRLDDEALIVILANL